MSEIVLALNGLILVAGMQLGATTVLAWQVYRVRRITDRAGVALALAGLRPQAEPRTAPGRRDDAA